MLSVSSVSRRRPCFTACRCWGWRSGRYLETHWRATPSERSSTGSVSLGCPHQSQNPACFHFVTDCRLVRKSVSGCNIKSESTVALVFTPASLSCQVNSSARGGVRFVGSVLQQVSGITNGRVHSPKRGCRSPPRTPPRTPPGDRELEETTYSPGESLVFPGPHFVTKSCQRTI